MGLGGVVGVIVVGVYNYGIGKGRETKALTVDECYRLGSNDRTNGCLVELAQRDTVTIDLTESQVSFENVTTEWEGSYTKTLNLKGKLTNKTEFAFNNITIQVKLYENKDGTEGKCSDTADDTKYITVYTKLFPKDPITIKEPIKSELISSGNKFQWCAKAVQAEI